eukprot:15222433-Alexandrium_andersonii.AAC.1
MARAHDGWDDHALVEQGHEVDRITVGRALSGRARGWCEAFSNKLMVWRRVRGRQGICKGDRTLWGHVQ